MARNKTTETAQSVTEFINCVTEETKRADSFRLVELIQQVTGFEAKMWGPNIVGFGSYHYKYASGHEGDAPLTGFSPRDKEFSLYLSSNFEGKEQLLQEFGKHRAAVSCIYFKKLSDVDEQVLKKMIEASVRFVQEMYS